MTQYPSYPSVSWEWQRQKFCQVLESDIVMRYDTSNLTKNRESDQYAYSYMIVIRIIVPEHGRSPYALAVLLLPPPSSVTISDGPLKMPWQIPLRTAVLATWHSKNLFTSLRPSRPALLISRFQTFLFLTAGCNSAKLRWHCWRYSFWWRSTLCLRLTHRRFGCWDRLSLKKTVPIRTETWWDGDKIACQAA